MHIGVNAGAAALFRRRQQAPVLVGAHVAHRGAGFAGQLVDGELLALFQLRKFAFTVGRALLEAA